MTGDIEIRPWTRRTSLDAEEEITAQCAFSADKASTVRRHARDWAREFAQEFGASRVHLTIEEIEATRIGHAGVGEGGPPATADAPKIRYSATAHASVIVE